MSPSPGLSVLSPRLPLPSPSPPCLLSHTHTHTHSHSRFSLFSLSLSYYLLLSLFLIFLSPVSPLSVLSAASKACWVRRPPDKNSLQSTKYKTCASYFVTSASDRLVVVYYCYRLSRPCSSATTKAPSPWHFTLPTNRLHATLTCASTSAANMLSWAMLLPSPLRRIWSPTL